MDETAQPPTRTEGGPALPEDMKDYTEESKMLLCFSLGMHLQYWDQFYENELMDCLPDDVGDSFEPIDKRLYCWYGRPVCAVIVAEILKLPLDKTKARVLDIGTGNGHMARYLESAGFASVVGVDYSPAAVRLAKTLEDLRSMTQDAASGKLAFLEDDILAPTKLGPPDNESCQSCRDGGTRCCHGLFDIILDKGGLDSVAMVAMPESEETRSQANEMKFSAKAYELLRPGGYLVTVSCNHAVHELEAIYCASMADMCSGPGPSAPGFSIAWDATATLNDEGTVMLVLQKPAPQEA